MSGDREYELVLTPEGARLSGVMRLVSPAAYHGALAEVTARLSAATSSFELDVSGLQFLNSSGITALSRLVMDARARGVPLVFAVDEAVAWQRKTLPSLAKLYPKITLRKV